MLVNALLWVQTRALCCECTCGDRVRGQGIARLNIMSEAPKAWVQKHSIVAQDSGRLHVSSNDYRGVRCPWFGCYIYIGAVVNNILVVKLRYGAGQGVPIVPEAWMCPVATANLFGNSSSFIFD